MSKFNGSNLIIIAIILLAAALRFYHIDAFSLWEDELFSVATATQSGPWYGPFEAGKSMQKLQLTDNFWTWKFSDPHPPLFEMLLVVWIKLFGTSDFALRSLTASLGVGTLLSVFALPRTITAPGRIVYVALLAASAPLLIYSQDVRNYSLGAFLSAWMFAFLLRQMDEDEAGLRAGRPHFLLLAAGGLLALTHYYGLIMTLSFAAIMTLRVRSIRAFCRASASWLLALVPIGIYIALGWAGIATKMNAAPPEALSLAMTFKRNTISLLHNIYPHVNTKGFWISMLVVLATLLIYKRMRSEQHILAPSAGAIAGILTLFFLVLILATRRAEFFSTRYVIFMFPGILLMLSIFTLVKGWPRAASLLLTAFLIPMGIWAWQLSPKPQNGGDWRGAAELVARLYGPNDIVIIPLIDPTMRSHFVHYLRKKLPQEQLDTRVLSITNPDLMPARLQALEHRPARIIFFTHASFQYEGNAMMDWLQKNYSCTAESWQNVQALRVAVVSCPP
ncbi:glycosyltransferase family 39 protein [Xylophilus sp. ASV27]|uniref:glycosyltransferase family 39 protein n=1 Tax=Xylophilus sp. ASV27 TaxID=2795129 RepID=UPI0018EBCCD2|nr:glycosyltransferase family 39 protein [Xylophilus sp. ASV27]